MNSGIAWIATKLHALADFHYEDTGKVEVREGEGTAAPVPKIVSIPVLMFLVSKIMTQ